MSMAGQLINRASLRRLAMVVAASAISAAAIAAPLVIGRQEAPVEEQVATSPTPQAFASALTQAVTDTLAANVDLTDLVALQGVLEEAIEAVFLDSNVTPENALAGVDLARAELLASGIMCELPQAQATQRCEAVALAFQLAERAAAAAQTDPTGALGSGNGSGAPLGPPPSSGSGGGGGGVTHPPVTL